MNWQRLAWLNDTALAEWIVSSAYIWPVLECIHFVSLCLFMGALLVIDLRLVGFYKEPCTSLIEKLVRFCLCAFIVNLGTGFMFFVGNTYKYMDNIAFEIKLCLILVAGLNALFYKLKLTDLVNSDRVTTSSIIVGYLSLLLWAGVIICGRMITFYAI
jgi:hypothetical protein